MRLFVSYRRSDTQDFAGRLVDRLTAAPGVRDVFFDVLGIEPGVNFEDRLRQAVARADVCLVLIGPHWRGSSGADGRARIDEPGDFVRAEVRQALQGAARVVPVLVNGAEMPAPTALPQDLAGLARLNALSIRHADFDRDVEHLLDVVFGRTRRTGARGYLDRRPAQAFALRSLLGAACGFIVLMVAAAAHFALTGLSLDEQLGGRGPTVLLILAALATGALVAHWLERARRGGR